MRATVQLVVIATCFSLAQPVRVEANGASSAPMLTSQSPLAALSRLVADDGVKVRSDVSYGPHGRHKLDVYEPEARGRSDRQRRPVVLFLYGGAWTTGDRSLYAFLGSALASRGFPTVIADYRLHPEVVFPEFVDDAARAYGWTAANMAANGSRPIVVMGHSAGAHIGGLLTFDPSHRARFAPRSAKPAGFIGLAGPYAFDPTTWPSTTAIFASAASNPERAQVTAVANRYPGKPPPVLLMHGSADTIVTPNASTELRSVLEARGGKVWHREYDIGHLGVMLAYARPLRWRANVLDPTIEFLARIGSTVAAPTRTPG